MYMFTYYVYIFDMSNQNTYIAHQILFGAANSPVDTVVKIKHFSFFFVAMAIEF